MQNKESRITDAEYEFLNTTFAGNKAGLKTLRKLFLYEIEALAPVGTAQDMWTTLDLSNLSIEEQLLQVKARQMMIRHIEGSLKAIELIAGEQKETVEEMKKRFAKNSAK